MNGLPSSSSETPPPHESQKLPALGIASLAGALVAVFSICGFIGFIQVYNGLNNSVQEKISILGWFFACLFPIGCLAAIGLGIAALVQKETNKTFAILGLVFGGFLMAALCVLAFLAVLLILLVGAGGYG